MKKALSILMVVCLMVSLCACDFLEDVADSAMNMEAEAKIFDFEGISIELTTDFLRLDFIDDDYEFIVGDEVLTVMGIKTLYEGTDLEDLTVLEFADNFRSLMEADNPTEITEMDGIPTMQYTGSDSEGEVTCAVMYYKASDCFWVVCFATSTEDFDGMYGDICRYAKTVKCE